MRLNRTEGDGKVYANIAAGALAIAAVSGILAHVVLDAFVPGLVAGLVIAVVTGVYLLEHSTKESASTYQTQLTTTKDDPYSTHSLTDIPNLSRSLHTPQPNLMAGKSKREEMEQADPSIEKVNHPEADTSETQEIPQGGEKPTIEELMAQQVELLKMIVSQNEQASDVKSEEMGYPYIHRFHVMKLLVETVPIGTVALGLLYVILTQNDSTSGTTPSGSYYWTLGIIVSAIAVYCWYRWLVWTNEYFMARPDRCVMPRHMPGPIPSQEPTIEVKSSSSGVKELVIDKIFKTCTFYADTPATGDEMFAKVRWLKHPDQLRDALGLVPMQPRFPRVRKLLIRRKDV